METTSAAKALTLGLDTFGDLTDGDDGRPLTQAQTIRNIVDEGILADQVGIDFFSIGEHHTDYFPLSAGDVVLGAIASRTSRMHLGSAVTVISSDDPVRVFQRYATLDALSNGRAEVILGRGSSIESFPLFGYDLRDYEELFEEEGQPVRRAAEGATGDVERTNPTRARRSLRVPTHRVRIDTDLDRRRRQPGVGHTLGAIRVLPHARHHRRFDPTIRSVRQPVPGGARQVRVLRAAGRRALPRAHRRDRRTSPRGVLAVLCRPRRPRRQERGFRVPTRATFDQEVGPHGALHVGSPETVARKIADTLTALDATRFDLKYGMGGLSHSKLMTNIELYGTEVAPLVHDMLA